jgi:hypothetical protein
MARSGNNRIVQPAMFTGGAGEVLWDRSGLLQRPDLARHIGVILSRASSIELIFGKFFVHCAGGPADVARAIYVEIDNSYRQRDALRAAAKMALDTGLYNRLDDLIKKEEPLRGERNKIAHALWYAGNDPTILLRQDCDKELAERTPYPLPPGSGSNNEAYAIAGRMEVYDELIFQTIEAKLDDFDKRVTELYRQAIGNPPYSIIP